MLQEATGHGMETWLILQNRAAVEEDTQRDTQRTFHDFLGETTGINFEVHWQNSSRTDALFRRSSSDGRLWQLWWLVSKILVPAAPIFSQLPICPPCSGHLLPVRQSGDALTLHLLNTAYRLVDGEARILLFICGVFFSNSPLEHRRELRSLSEEAPTRTQACWKRSCRQVLHTGDGFLLQS